MCIRDSTSTSLRIPTKASIGKSGSPAFPLPRAAGVFITTGLAPVSYTHLDVYKRQQEYGTLLPTMIDSQIV